MTGWIIRAKTKKGHEWLTVSNKKPTLMAKAMMKKEVIKEDPLTLRLTIKKDSVGMMIANMQKEMIDHIYKGIAKAVKQSKGDVKQHIEVKTL